MASNTTATIRSIVTKRNRNKQQQPKETESAGVVVDNTTMPLPTFAFPKTTTAKPTSPSSGGSDVTYNANGTALRRFRTPAPHDVLSGRGGSVNAHPGNCQFRDWVAVRKEDYNLARTKQQKADICRQVIAQVVALGGRFLTKETPNSPWWIEQDEERIMAKTSQALREGAPKIREAHKEELGLTTNFSRRKPRNSTAAHVTTRAAPQSTSKRALGESAVNHTEHNSKRVRVDYKGHMVLTHEDTPPLRSVEAPSHNDATTNALPIDDDFQLMPAPARFPPPLSRARLAGIPNASSSALTRTHSLAISDIIADESYEFVNPFDDESDLLFASTSFSHRNSFSFASPRPGMLRETSVSSTTSDFAGLGALIRGPTTTAADANHKSNNLDFLTPDASESAAHIVDNEEDNRSVATESTLGLPLWDWFNRDDHASPQTHHHPIPISLQ